MANDNSNLTREQQLALYRSQFFTKLGASGVLVQNGVISREEYKRDLSGKKGIETFNEMRRSDGTVRAAIMAVMLPLLGANWHVQPASDDPQDMLAAQIVEVSLFKNLSWDDFARQAFTFLPFGFSLFEHEYEIGTVDGREYILLKDMGFRKQTSLVKWQMEDGNPGITQLLSNGKKANIPDVKLTRFTFEQEGDNYEGVSLLRSAYKHWYMKTELELIDAMAHEKQGLGILKVRTPAQAKDEDKEAAREIAREQRANEENFIEEMEGYSFDFMDMKAKTTRDIVPSIQYHNRQILQSVLTQFLDIGSSGSSGSFSASDNQLDLFFASEEAIAKEFAEPINQTVVKNLMELNGLGSRPEAPKVTYDRIGSDAINVLSEALNKLFTSGGLTPDPEVENYIRSFLHLPPLTDEMVANYDQIRALRKNPAVNPQGVQPQLETGTPAEAEAKAASELIKQARVMRDRLRSFANGTSNR
jgi:phage gp29-like protein